jgi:hypothetical protein
LPYSDYPRNIARYGPTLIQIRCKLICFRPVQSFDLLGWGSSPHSARKNCTLGGGPVLTVLFVARAHQPTLWVDLRVDGLHQPTLNTQYATSSASSSTTSTSSTSSIASIASTTSTIVAAVNSDNPCLSRGTADRSVESRHFRTPAGCAQVCARACDSSCSPHISELLGDSCCKQSGSSDLNTF